MDEGTLFAWDVGVMDVIFETDSISVSHALVDPVMLRLLLLVLSLEPTQSYRSVIPLKFHTSRDKPTFLHML